MRILSIKKVLVSVFLLVMSLNSVGQTGFGASAPCNINAVCDYPWCNQRRGVVMISRLVNGVYIRKGSGSLIANEKKDGRPYVLTANHLIDIDNDGSISPSETQIASTLLFTFNYQSANCPNPPTAPDTVFSVTGANIVASKKDFGDFALLELFSRPAGNYNVYYNGWSNISNKPDNIHMIHHPQVDIKKISYSNDKPKKQSASKWEVKEWTDGTSEGGSSGAPWFSQNKLIVGHQSSNAFNNQPCTNALSSFAGRFDYNWANYNASNEQLRAWLNPSGNGQSYIVSLVGFDPCKPSYSFSNVNDLHTSANINYINAEARAYDGVYMASGVIEAGPNVTVLNATSVQFQGQTVILKAGFTALNGSEFLAAARPCIGGCDAGVGKMQNNNDENEDLFTLNTDIVEKTGEEYEEEDFNLEKSSIIIMDNMVLFPNPSNGQFSLLTSLETNETYSIKINDILGREIFSRSNINSNGYDIDLSSESKGVYLINIIKKGNVYVKKLILQ